MEVEFLSNMRYSLLASSAQWDEWQTKLGSFWNYFEMAQQAPLPVPSPTASLPPILPSPPSSMNASPPSGASLPLSTAPYNYSYNHGYAPSPLNAMPPLATGSLSRKRSFDGDSHEPPAKRTHGPTAPLPSYTNTSALSARQSAPRLPIPNLTISTSHAEYTPNPMYNVHHLPALPPLNGRAMSTVFPTTPAYTPHLPLPNPLNHTAMPHAQSLGSTAYPTTSSSRRPSPPSIQNLLPHPSHSHQNNSSPLSASFPANSPSIFLQQRNSPYKPVRHVSTLTYPPTSSSMGPMGLHGPSGLTAHGDSMQYLPLGRRNDYRVGVVPEYMGWQGYGDGGLPGVGFGHGR